MAIVSASSARTDVAKNAENLTMEPNRYTTMTTTEQEISDTPPDEGLISDEQDFFPKIRKKSIILLMNQARKQIRTESESEWDKRILCSDGNCIGVIGPDGRCKECGKPYEG
jgi:hypothetical protein